MALAIPCDVVAASVAHRGASVSAGVEAGLKGRGSRGSLVQQLGSDCRAPSRRNLGSCYVCCSSAGQSVVGSGVASRTVRVRCVSGGTGGNEFGRRETLRMASTVLLGMTLSNWAPQIPLLGDTEMGGGIANAADIVQRFQRAEFVGKVREKLRDVVKENQELIPDLLKLALNDAMTYDKATRTGGANGSVRFELDRPENAGLGPAVKLLEKVKKDLDEELSKWPPITWADLIQLAAQSATKRTFINAAISKCGGNEEKGLLLYTAYGSVGQWGQFDKLLGRADATGPDPEGRVPDWEKASPSEITAKFAEVGIKPRYIPTLSAFMGHSQLEFDAKLQADEEYFTFVQNYQTSRKTVSQTDYEVDLINTFSKVSVLGQKINYEAYTYNTPPPQLRF